MSPQINGGQRVSLSEKGVFLPVGPMGGGEQEAPA